MDFLNRLKTSAMNLFKPIATSGPLGAAGNLMNTIGGAAMTQPAPKPTQTFSQTIDTSIPASNPVQQQNFQEQTQNYNNPNQSSTNPFVTDNTFKIDTSNITSKNLTPTTTPSDVLNYRKEMEAKFKALKDARDALQQQYINQTAYSPEYQQAQANLISDKAGYRQGLQDIMNKPIGMDFQTGQSAALTRDAALKLQANADVANYYEKLRTNNLAQTEAQLGFNKDQFSNQMDVENAIQDYTQNYNTQNKPFSVGEGTSIYNPATGQVEFTNPKTQNDALTAGQINTTVNSIASAFDNEPIVKNYNVIAEGYNFAKSLAGNTKPTSADDQGLVYAFAKAMDPNSAVKEGEYITVQKYNQSLVQKGWANAKRIVDNVAFLTPEARNNMVKTIESKYKASQSEYNNVSKEYQRQIDDAYSGKPRQITNYTAGVTANNTTPSISQTGGLETNW